MAAMAARDRYRRGYSREKLNDIHSALNPTVVAERIDVRNIGDVIAGLEFAVRRQHPVAVCGGRHAMGGQQFASNGIALDLNGLDQVLNFDSATGLIEVEAGIQWPKLMHDYQAMQEGSGQQWAIRQKQTGADRLSIGGALAANIHGRVLDNKPIVEDVVSFRIIDASGRLLNCSRQENAELFSLAIGGYGLFGVIVTVTLQLVPRKKLQRVVELRELGELQDLLDERVRDGYLYGDFQFQTDAASPGFLKRGVFSCYRPVAADLPIPADQVYMSKERWQDLLVLAHTDKSGAFDAFAEFYLTSDQQLYWSDTHQLSLYLDDYHRELDTRLNCAHRGSEMITELYVPREQLVQFMDKAAGVLRATDADLIYGTIRQIKRDDETFLAWAREDFACVIFNLHVEHTRAGVERARSAFVRLIDAALDVNGSYFLTYHRYADEKQLRCAYPQFDEFIRRKKLRDPHELFASDWYRHYAGSAGGADE